MSRQKLHNIVFGTDTPAGRWFDLIVIGLILISVITVILETIPSIGDRWPVFFNKLEWSFTILFTVEYAMRIYAALPRRKYITSFYGITDLISIIPTYLGLIITGQPSLLIIRVLRILRIFRIFGMGHFVSEGAVVVQALQASRTKILVFLSFMGISVILLGAIMFMVEEGQNPSINSMPEGIYWAIVTLTTVGYGDTVPVTVIGRILASVVMIMGYGIIAIPTGIVTAEITNTVFGKTKSNNMICPNCGNTKHLKNAAYCQHCGEALI